jgi:hypothetical protein
MDCYQFIEAIARQMALEVPCSYTTAYPYAFVAVMEELQLRKFDNLLQEIDNTIVDRLREVGGL